MIKKIILLLIILSTLSFINISEAEFSDVSLNQKIKIIFGKEKFYRADLDNLSQSYNTFYKSATLTILEAKNHPEYLRPENKFVLRRPTDSNDPDYYGIGITVLTYDTPEGNFKIHYTEDNTYGDAVKGSDGDPLTIPIFVIDIGAAFEKARRHILSLGYPALPDDGGKGGDNKFDVYIMNLPGSFGFTSYDDTPSDVYIVVDNDFAVIPENLDPEGSQKGAIKVTAAHELFHAFQLQYSIDITSNGWWMEASSTWMEDEIFPEVKDYLNYVGLRYDDANDNGRWDIGETYYKIDGSIAGTTGRVPKWFDRPEYSLDSTSGSHEYGTCIWVKYLSKTYGIDIVKLIWEEIGEGKDAITAISNKLDLIGNKLSSVFAFFQLANYIRDYPDGNYYPPIKQESTYTIFPQAIIGFLNHLSSNFYTFKADSSKSTLTLTFIDMNSDSLAVKLILNKVGGDYEVQDVTLDNDNVVININNFGISSIYDKVVMIVMNTSFSKDGKKYSVNASKENSSNFYSGNASRGDCFIATAVFGSHLDPKVQVLRDLRDDYLLRNAVGRLFIKFYYKISPQIAYIIREHEVLKTATRWALTPVVYALKYLKLTIVLFASCLFVRYISFRKKIR